MLIRFAGQTDTVRLRGWEGSKSMDEREGEGGGGRGHRSSGLNLTLMAVELVKRNAGAVGGPGLGHIWAMREEGTSKEKH